jgi:hypothetical protein
MARQSYFARVRCTAPESRIGRNGRFSLRENVISRNGMRRSLAMLSTIFE